MANKHQLRHIQPQALGQHCKGFTLVELLVTIAIGTLLLVVAVPGFVAFQRNAQLSDAASNFIAAINIARANAMKQGINTYLVPKIGTDWGTGWIVYADPNFNKSYDIGESVILGYDAPAASVSIGTSTGSFSDGYVLFNGSGYPRLKNSGFGGGTLVMRNVARSSSIIIDPAGRVRSCQTGTTGC